MFNVADRNKKPLGKASFKPTPPPLVRKKSGEIVKPAIKPKLLRSNSAPTKFVHFDSQLEYVKLFMKGERPETISNPPSDEEFSDLDDFSESSSENEDEMQLSIRLPNFPPSIFSAYSKPVIVEKVYLSEDKSALIGDVMVHNLAYQKSVTLRYTFDFWQSVEEVQLDYKDVVINASESFSGVDKFQFAVSLQDKVSLKIGAPKKNMFFAIKYQVNGEEHWDNNEGVNYQVEFVVSKPLTNRRSNTWPVSTHTNEKSWNFKSSHSSEPAPLKSAFSGKLGSRYSFGVSLGPMLTAEPLDISQEEAPKPSFSSAYFFSTKSTRNSKNSSAPQHSNSRYQYSSWDDQSTEFDYSRYSSNNHSPLSSSPVYGSYEMYSGSPLSGYSSPYGVSPTPTCIRG